MNNEKKEQEKKVKIIVIFHEIKKLKKKLGIRLSINPYE